MNPCLHASSLHLAAPARSLPHNHARYDAAGNLITIPGTGSSSYLYDAENHLKQVTSGGTITNYAYDGDGRRVEKLNSSSVVTKLYWYGIGSDPLDESDAAGAINNAAFKEFIFFNGKRIASRDSSNAVNYYFTDHLGTARIVANASGTVLDDSDFYPFGGERVMNSTSGNRYKFTSKERDTESNLDNFGARFDSSSLGRFMSPDIGAFRIEDPQSLNRYAYVLNNPLRFIDPDGRDPLDPAVLEQLKHFDQIVDQRVKQLAYNYLVSHTSMVVSARVGAALGQIASPSDSVVYGGYLNLTSAEQDELSLSIANSVETWIADPKTTIDQLKSAAWDVNGMLESLRVPDALTFFLSMKQQLALLLASSPRERLLKKLQEELEDSIRRKQEEEEQRKRREAECANDPKKCPDNPGVPQPATTGPSL